VRLSLVIAILVAIWVGLVHLRHEKVRAGHEIQRLQMRQVSLRRRLWDQEVRIGELTTPDRVRGRAKQMPLQLVEKYEVPTPVVTYRPGTGSADR